MKFKLLYIDIHFVDIGNWYFKSMQVTDTCWVYHEIQVKATFG